MARSNRPHPNSVKKYVRQFLAALETRESITADDGYTAESFAAHELGKMGYPTERFLSMGHSAYGGPAQGNYTYNKPMIRIFRRPVTDGTVNAIT